MIFTKTKAYGHVLLNIMLLNIFSKTFFNFLSFYP